MLGGGENENDFTIPKDSSPDSCRAERRNDSSSSESSPETTSIDISGNSSG